MLNELHKSQIPRMAAALSYRTLFGMIPMMVIGLVILGTLMNDDQIEQEIKRFMTFVGFDTIVVEMPDDAASDVGSDAAPAEVDEPTDDAASEEPEQEVTFEDEEGTTGEHLNDLIEELVGHVNSAVESVPTGRVAFIMAMILLYAALSMLVEVERAFNHLYRAPKGRQWRRRIVLYWAVLTLGTILLVATFSVGSYFSTWFSEVSGGGSTLVGGLGFLTTVVISTTLIFVGYLIVPNTRVHFRPALAGAVVAAVLWEAGKWAFGAYVNVATGYERFYGSLALLPLFLIWVYVTWIIVLFGLQVSYALQHFGQFNAELADDGPQLVDASSTLAVAIETARLFKRGEPSTVDALASLSGLSPISVEALLEQLKAAGFMHQVAGGGDGSTWALARPAEDIKATSVLEASAAIIETAGTAEIIEIRTKAIALLGDRTLSDLAGDPSDADG